MYKHSCLKCHNSYEDTDQDPYLCPGCLEEKKRIAAEIDSKFTTVGKKPKSLLDEYKSAPKVGGFMYIKQ